MTDGRIELGRVTPVLRVKDLRASLEYYRLSLGFEVTFCVPSEEEGYFAGIHRGETSLFLSVGDQGHVGAWVWIDGKDVRRLHEELVARGAVIRNPPTNYPWALEMQVEDPDGNVLRFGSARNEDGIYGTWFDMDGARWLPTANGGWAREEK